MTQPELAVLGEEIYADIEPERLEEIALEVAKEDYEQFSRLIDEYYERGWFVWARAKPQERLRNFYFETLPEDFAPLMDDEYRKALIDGLAPPLASQGVIDAWQMARDEALVKGETIPQDVPRYVFWAMLLNAWPPLFDKVARDFRSLVRAEQREWEREAAMMMEGDTL